MSWRRIKVVIRKEWLDICKNRMTTAMLFVLPVILVGMILGTAWVMVRAPEQMQEPIIPDGTPGLPLELEAMSSHERTLALLNDQYMFYLLILPLVFPVYIAAHSIIGEKETRSLEPLLATPISTAELLVAKILVAVTPAVISAWLSYAITALGMYLIASQAVFLFLVRPFWTVGMLIHSPLFALMSASGGVIVSSRVNDARVAQQVSGLLVLPLIGVSIAVLMGRVYLDTTMLLWVTPVVLALNGGILWLAARLFQRETILTRWK